MPLTIKKDGSQYVVTDPSGKKFGKHKTKQEAIDQIAAIEMSKKTKSGLDLAAAQRISELVAEIEKSTASDQPPIVIISDGSPEGTMLMLNGQTIPAKRISLYCSNDPDYPNCDLSITIEEVTIDGLTVEKTLSLRKQPPSLKDV